MKKNNKLEKKALILAQELDDYEHISDPYEYMDSVDDPLDNIECLKETLLEDVVGTKSIVNTLQMDIDEDMYCKNEAKVLLEKVKKFTKLSLGIVYE